MGEHGDGQKLSPKTIFSQVLDPPANRQEAEKFSGRPGDKAVKYALPTLRLGQEDHFMLVVTSSMRQLTIGPGGNNARRGRTLLRGHRRVAILPPCSSVLPIEVGTTSLNPNAPGPTIEDIMDRE